jgi:hypothetical protein
MKQEWSLNIFNSGNTAVIVGLVLILFSAWWFAWSDGDGFGRRCAFVLMVAGMVLIAVPIVSALDFTF